MPKETFWNSATAVENDGVSEPVLTVTWGEKTPGVHLNGVEFDESGINRLVSTLRRAIGKDERTVTINFAMGNQAELAKLITKTVRDGIKNGSIPPA